MKIIHLSDLHFGTSRPTLIQELTKTIRQEKADIMIISGDLTQVASTAEFEKAQNFIVSFDIPVLSIPGNHDISPTKLLERFFKPYDKFKKYVGSDLNPVLNYKNCSILGLNSARRALPHWNWANGAVSQKQRTMVENYFNDQKEKYNWRIITLHHPIHTVQNQPIDVTVFGAQKTLDCFEKNKIDIVLTGHVHHASVTKLGTNHKTLYISASTALSSRKRNQDNGFNIIRLEENRIDVDMLTLNDDKFTVTENYSHQRFGITS